MNEETFKIWLDKKALEKQQETEAKAKKKLKKKGKKGLTGRELFSLTPNIFKDDDNAESNIIFEKDQENKPQIDTQKNQQKDDKSSAATKTMDNDKVEIGDESLFLDDGLDDMLDEMEIID